MLRLNETSSHARTAGGLLRARAGPVLNFGLRSVQIGTYQASASYPSQKLAHVLRHLRTLHPPKHVVVSWEGPHLCTTGRTRPSCIALPPA